MLFTSIISIFAIISSAPAPKPRAQADCQWSRKELPEAAANRSQHVRAELWSRLSVPLTAEASGRDGAEAAARDNGHRHDERAPEDVGHLTTDRSI